MANNNNPFGNNPFGSGDSDPFEELFKKLSEQGGFDPSAMNNLDPEDLKNMGIPVDPSMLSGIFAQVSSMMSAQPTDEPVNWDLARKHARQVVAGDNDPSVTGNQKSAVADATQLADLWLDPVTGFDRPGYTTEGWSKAEWVENSFEAWQEMSGPVAISLSEAMSHSIETQIPEEMKGLMGGGSNMFNGLGGMMFGMQMGQAIGGLAGDVVSSTDIGIPLAPGRSALVLSGIEKFGEGLEIPKQEVMLFLAVREAALVRLHKANPWLREDIMELIKRYSRGIHVDIERMQEAANNLDIDPTNPESIQEAFAGDVFKPQNTEDQQLALGRLENLLALIEGWVTVVTAEATKNLPMAAQLTETMARRRATGGPAEHVFASLVGLELRPRMAREAAEFWTNKTEELGVDERDALWHAPETLPTGEELADLGQYAERTEMLNATEDEFDAALEKLLAGGYDEAPTENEDGTVDSADSGETDSDDQDGEDSEK